LITDKLKQLIKENKVLDDKFQPTEEWVELLKKFKEYKKQNGISFGNKK